MPAEISPLALDSGTPAAVQRIVFALPDALRAEDEMLPSVRPMRGAYARLITVVVEY